MGLLAYFYAVIGAMNHILYTVFCQPDHDLRPPLFIHLQFFFLHFTDIEECQNKSSNDCEQLCVNIPASFFCDCRDGYKLNVDGLNCDGKTLALPCSLFMFEARCCFILLFQYFILTAPYNIDSSNASK